MNSARLMTADGIELVLTDHRGEGTPVVFVHGFSNDRYVWDDVALALPAQFRPIAYDSRGHGETSAPAAVRGFSASDIFKSNVS